MTREQIKDAEHEQANIDAKVAEAFQKLRDEDADEQAAQDACTFERLRAILRAEREGKEVELRREGMIAGLEWVLPYVDNPRMSYDAILRVIRAEIERLRALTTADSSAVLARR